MMMFKILIHESYVKAVGFGFSVGFIAGVVAYIAIAVMFGR